jgi:hypothetical protein
MNAEEKKIFEDAFYLGFMTSIDGWTGESFSLSQRKPTDSAVLMVAMGTRRERYELEQNEKAKLFPAILNDDFECTGV